MALGHNAPEPRAVEMPERDRVVTGSLPSRWWAAGTTVIVAARKMTFRAPLSAVQTSRSTFGVSRSTRSCE